MVSKTRSLTWQSRALFRRFSVPLKSAGGFKYLHWLTFTARTWQNSGFLYTKRVWIQHHSSNMRRASTMSARGPAVPKTWPFSSQYFRLIWRLALVSSCFWERFQRVGQGRYQLSSWACNLKCNKMLIAVYYEVWISFRQDRIKSSSRSLWNWCFTLAERMPTDNEASSSWPDLAGKNSQPKRFSRVHRTVLSANLLLIRSKKNWCDKKIPSR